MSKKMSDFFALKGVCCCWLCCNLFTVFLTQNIIMDNLFLLAGDSSVSEEGFILPPEVESLAEDQQTVVKDHQVSGQTDNYRVINYDLKIVSCV